VWTDTRSLMLSNAPSVPFLILVEALGWRSVLMLAEGVPSDEGWLDRKCRKRVGKVVGLAEHAPVVDRRSNLLDPCPIHVCRSSRGGGTE